MAYDPSVHGLDRYVADIESGRDPFEAWEDALGASDPASREAWTEDAEEASAPVPFTPSAEGGDLPDEDPAESYVRLLESGWSPHVAWETTYGAKRHWRKGLPPRVLGFVPEAEVRSDTVWFYSHATPEEGDGYTSYIYTVGYRYKGTGSWMWTWARVDIPDVDFSTIDTLGVVLLVEGDLSHTVGVNPQGESRESWYEARSRLAGGRVFSEEKPGDVDSNLPYRDPPEETAMVVVSFTQPGRGPETQRATADPECVGLTPDNFAQGRDWWGETTCDAMEAVMTMARNVAAEIEAQCAPNPTTRYVILSTSAGLVAASTWMARGAWPIHALVDTEGPSDSMEITGAHNAWTEDDIGSAVRGVLTGEILECDLPTDLGWDRWQNWALAELSTWPGEIPQVFPFFYRPPLSPMTDWSASDVGEEFVGALSIRFGDRGGAGWFLLPSLPLGDLVFRTMMVDFWESREPIRTLPAALASGTAYIRIQGRVNHADQPNWYQCRNAVRNLHIAWEATGGGRVYLADQTWLEAISAEYSVGSITTGPSAMTGDLDPDHFSGAWPSWPLGQNTDNEQWEIDAEEADFTKRYFVTRAWQAQVDVIRWVTATSFTG